MMRPTLTRATFYLCLSIVLCSILSASPLHAAEGMRYAGGLLAARSAINLSMLSGAYRAGPLARNHPAKPQPAAQSGYINLDDLPQIQARGELRVVLLAEQGGQIHSKTLARNVEQERAAISAFAADHQLRLRWLDAGTPAELQHLLTAGHADVIIGEAPLIHSDTDPLAAAIAQTVAIKRTQYQALVRANDTRAAGLTELSQARGMRVALSRQSALWQVLPTGAGGEHRIELVTVPDGMGQNELLDAVAQGIYDLTLVEAATDQTTVPEDLRVAFSVTDEAPAAWLLRRQNPQLLAALNHYLNQHPVAWREWDTHVDDWSAIRARGVLRVITVADTDNYFLKNGERAGFAYEILREFARAQKLRLDLRVANSEAEMRVWLKAGVGDVIMTRLDNRLAEANTGLSATRVFHYEALVLITRADFQHDAADPLAGQARAPLRIWAARGSLAAESLKGGLSGMSAYKLIEADGTREELLAAVSSGRADATVIAARYLTNVLRAHPELQAKQSLPNPYPYRFTTRASNPALITKLNEFWNARGNRTLVHNLAARYFDKAKLEAASGTASISPYDALVRVAAEKYSFDWRLIIALMYQESRFDANARSHAGAEGLMQVMPETAIWLMGERVDLDHPETAVQVGVRYLDTTRDQFEDSLAVEDRTWFTIAAYHAGTERVQRVRREAARMGLDPNRWFGQVEKAMQQYAESEDGWRKLTINYVHDVRARYQAYLELAPATLADNRMNSTPQTRRAVRVN